MRKIFVLFSKIMFFLYIITSQNSYAQILDINCNSLEERLAYASSLKQRSQKNTTDYIERPPPEREIHYRAA